MTNRTAWTTTVAKEVWRAALRSRSLPACCPHRPFSTGSPAQEKGWSTQGMKKKTAAHSTDGAAAPAEAAAGGRSVSLNGGTVDKAEVDKFGAIGASWWDLEGMQKPLHSFNALRIRFVQSMMAQHLNKARRQGESKVSMGDALKGLRIVDVGCGGGILAEGLCRLGADVLAIDAAGENIRVAEEHARSVGLLSSSSNAGGGVS